MNCAGAYTRIMHHRQFFAFVLVLVLAGTLGAGSPGVAETRAAAPPLSAATSLSSGPSLSADPSLSAALPLAGIVIALNPGHNGGNASHIAQISRLVWAGNRWKACDTVGTTTVAGYPEHRFNYLVALRVKSRLEALGATVYMTRTSDTGTGPCISVRGQFGSRVHARLTLSIHADGSRSGNRGFFVMRPGFVRGYTDDIMARSAVLARALRTGLVRAGLPIANYYASNGIIARTDLGTLNRSDVPAVMVELGNMKNRSDAARMTSGIGRDRYARGLVAGIRIFLGK